VKRRSRHGKEVVVVRDDQKVCLFSPLELMAGSIRDRPSLRSVFVSPEKDKKTKSVISNTHTTPKGKARDRDSEIRDKDDKGSWGRRKTKRTPLLIKHLGAVDKRKGESTL
jgi:hypothetical protein